jgi:hypothetical protein
MKYLILYPVLGILYTILTMVKYDVVTGAILGILTGYVMASSESGAILLGGSIMGLLVAGRLNTPRARLGVALMLVTVLNLGAPLIPLIPPILMGVGVYLDLVGGLRGRSIFTPMAILVLMGIRAVEVLDTAGFLLAVVIYTSGGMRFAGAEHRRYPGFRRRH